MAEVTKEMISGGRGKPELGEIPLRLSTSTVPILRSDMQVLVSVGNEAVHLKATEDWEG